MKRLPARLVDSLAGPVALLTAEGTIVDRNEAAADLACPGTQGLGIPLWALGAWAADSRTGALLRQGVHAAAAGRTARVDAPLATGAMLRVDLRPLAAPGEQVEVIVAEVHDITALHATAERLRAADARRAHAVQAIAHDLRAPLAVVLALIDHVRADGVAGAACSDDLAALADAAETMSGHIDALVDAAREPGGAGVPPLGAEDLAALVRSLVRESCPVARERGVSISVVAPACAVVRGDRRTLASVVVNLIHNALRFAASAVEVRVEPAGPLVRMTVADDGPGIPAHLRADVFERFQQGGRAPGVAGLGLAIVRDGVASHGGTIRLLDCLDGGAQFVVELPRLVVATPHPEAPQAGTGAVGVGVVGADGRWLRADDALCVLLSLGPEEVAGTAVGPTVRGRVRSAVARALAGDGPAHAEIDQYAPGVGPGRRTRWTITASGERAARIVVVCARSVGAVTGRRRPSAAGGRSASGPPPTVPGDGGTPRDSGADDARRATRGP